MGTHLPARRADWSARETTDEERALLERFIDAHERGDTAAAISIAAQDIRITMPPNSFFYEGLDTIAPLLAQALRDGEWRLVATRANRMPTAASYLRQAGDSEFRAFKFDVLRIEHGVIAEITTFGAELFPAFGLPQTL
jgi:RNA polymerase sigma-70 factor (ECF subfamily)